jgi:hypothetical protein
MVHQTPVLQERELAGLSSARIRYRAVGARDGQSAHFEMLLSCSRRDTEFAGYTEVDRLRLDVTHGAGSEIKAKHSLAKLRTNDGDVLL